MLRPLAVRSSPKPALLPSQVCTYLYPSLCLPTNLLLFKGNRQLLLIPLPGAVMARPQEWPRCRATSTDPFQPPDSSSALFQQPHCRAEYVIPHDRWAVHLNEPTIASLRRHNVLSTPNLAKNTMSTMPVATGSQSLLASLPTFMSVFGEGNGTNSGNRGKSGIQSASTALKEAPSVQSHTIPTRTATYPSTQPIPEHRRGSSATLHSESTESSPTTTISTVDSSMTESSPSSSPESPNSLLPMTSLGTLKPLTPTIERSMMDLPSNYSSLSPSPTRPNDERSDSPGKRPRNTKNLFINTSGISTKQSAHASMAASALGHIAESSTSSLPAVSDPNGVVVPNNAPTGVGPGAIHAFSAPASPSFILPSIPPPRRSRLNLTITTLDPGNPHSQVVPFAPAFAPNTGLRSRRSDLGRPLNPVPETSAYGSISTPLSAMRERDATSGQPLFSPSVAPRGGMQLPPFQTGFDPTLPTPAFGPEGGMQLPPPASSLESSPQGKTRPPLSIARPSFDAPSSSSVVQHTVEHTPQIPAHDLPLSREIKSPSYPDGPICIYSPGVFLYHQPTCDEAREFDVVINVAREVSNPFLAEGKDEAGEQVKEEPRYKDAAVQCTILPGEPDPLNPPISATSDASFGSTFESLAIDDGPETPKASTAIKPFKPDPEYIHLPWEHNSKVYDNWLEVCRLIDDRVKQGKKVLIHCQLGVSRSASLIVAYGIFINPSLSPDEARENAKKRSRWIDLNMHFMYELGDFKKLLAERYPNAHSTKRPPPQPMGLTRIKTDSVLATRIVAQSAIDAPAGESGSGAGFFGADSRGPSGTQYATNHADAFSPGPSTAPVGSKWPLSGLPDAFDHEPETPPAHAPPPPRRAPPAPPPVLPIAESNEETPASLIPEKRGKEDAPFSTLKLSTPSIPVENQAKSREQLPPPNLTLPTPTPRKALRAMPSLPAGFHSTLSKRSPPRERGFKGVNHLTVSTALTNGNAPPSSGDPDDLAILSPRVQEFTASPFHRSSAGDLAGFSIFENEIMSPRSQAIDPRSPPTRGEAPIIRNIEDVL